MTSIIQRIDTATFAVENVWGKMEDSYIPLDQEIQYLVLASPVLAEYKDKFQRPEEKKKEIKPIQEYKDLTEEDALKCIKERDAAITLDNPQKELF